MVALGVWDNWGLGQRGLAKLFTNQGAWAVVAHEDMACCSAGPGALLISTLGKEGKVLQ
jgi:hypothetical protein